MPVNILNMPTPNSVKTRTDKIYDNLRFRYLLNPNNPAYKSIVSSTRNITKRDINANTINAVSTIGFSRGSTQEWSWVQTADSILDNEGTGIATDNMNNVYVTGIFRGVATFGTITVTSSGSDDIFVAKYNSNGNVQWVQSAGGTGFDQGVGIATDSSSNVYITGAFEGVATFGTITVTSSGFNDIFVAKYDDFTGDAQWVQTAGSAFFDKGVGIATDNANKVYVTGHFSGTATFGTITVTSSGFDDIFVAQYDDFTGDAQWVQSAGGTDFDRGAGIATDSSNVYITGVFQGTATFGTITVISSGFADIFVTKYNSASIIQWVQTAGGTDFDQGLGITTDGSNNVYVTGGFRGVATFGTITVTSSGSRDIFVAKYDDFAGDAQWVQTAGGTGFDQGVGIATDSSSNVYITGAFEGVATFGTITVTSSGFNDLFVAKYDSDGGAQWVETAGGSGFATTSSQGIATDNANNVYVTGSFEEEATFGTITVTSSPGIFNFFVAKIIPGNSPVIITRDQLIKSVFGNKRWRNFGVARDKNLHDVRIPKGNIIIR